MAKNRILAEIYATILAALFVLGPGSAVAQPQSSGTPGRAAAEGSASMPAVQVDKDYRVGAGDMIEISVWKEPEVSTTVTVRPDGKISLPLVNDLVVSGMTPMQIQEIVAEKLDPLIKLPNVTVIVRQINSKKVYVLGMVNRTGSYQITQPTTVLQILTEAGGLQPYAKEKSIYVLRVESGRQQKFPFNYKDVVQGKKIEQNIFLQPGDTVVVP